MWRIESRLPHYLSGQARAWNFSAQPEYQWSAQDYSTPHLLPYVGRSPGSTAIFVATGMHKWGLSNGTVAAGILSDLIADRDNRWASLFDAGRIGDPHAVAKLLMPAPTATPTASSTQSSRPAHTSAAPSPGTNADTTWDCNCHGSRFDPDGAILDGPATRPLDPS